MLKIPIPFNTTESETGAKGGLFLLASSSTWNAAKALS